MSRLNGEVLLPEENAALLPLTLLAAESAANIDTRNVPVPQMGMETDTWHWTNNTDSD